MGNRKHILEYYLPRETLSPIWSRQRSHTRVEAVTASLFASAIVTLSVSPKLAQDIVQVRENASESLAQDSWQSRTRYSASK